MPLWHLYFLYEVTVQCLDHPFGDQFGIWLNMSKTLPKYCALNLLPLGTGATNAIENGKSYWARAFRLRMLLFGITEPEGLG